MTRINFQELFEHFRVLIYDSFVYWCMIVRKPLSISGKNRFTVEEYLLFEESSLEKHEYHEGNIYAMAGARGPHNEISMNISTLLNNRLKNKGCKPYSSDQRIYIPDISVFTYPDVSIFCDEMSSWNNDQMNSINPSVIIEVMSPSTRKYDENEKFELYRRILTLKEYILIDSISVYIEVWKCNGKDRWELKKYKRLEDYLAIRSLNVRIQVKDIYRGTALERSGMTVAEPEVEYGKNKVSIEEYLEMENKADQKHEYYEGEVSPMPVNGITHNNILMNLIGTLKTLSKGKSYCPFLHAFRIYIPEHTLFTYPDITIFGSNLIAYDKDEDTIIHPTGLIEVSPPTTGGGLNGEIFHMYRDIPTLKEYLVIDSECVHVESYRVNKKGNWELQEYKKTSDSITMESLGVSISLQEIYDDTGLTDAG